MKRCRLSFRRLFCFFLSAGWLLRKLNAQKLEAEINKTGAEVSLIKNSTLEKWQKAAEAGSEEKLRLTNLLIESETYNAKLVRILIENGLKVPEEKK